MFDNNMLRVGSAKNYILYLSRHGEMVSFNFCDSNDNLITRVNWEPEINVEAAQNYFLDTLQDIVPDDGDDDVGLIRIIFDKQDKHLIFIFDQLGGNANIDIPFFIVDNEEKFKKRLYDTYCKLFDFVEEEEE